MYDLTDLIFEKYSEGKLTEEKMILLLEANKDDEVFKQELESFEVIPDNKMTYRDKARDAKLKKAISDDKGIMPFYAEDCYKEGQKRPLTKFEYSLAKRYVDKLIKERKSRRTNIALTAGTGVLQTYAAVAGAKSNNKLHNYLGGANAMGAISSAGSASIQAIRLKNDKKAAEEARQRLQNKKNKK
jgi:hypothetical protein